jgi:hypothetical protein
MIADPKSWPIWRSLLLKRQFFVGTATDLFKMIPARLFDEAARLKIVDFLVQKKLLVKGEWFVDAKGSATIGYMKGSPADVDVSLSLADFGFDVEEYKRSLEAHRNEKRVIDGKMINRSFLYTESLQKRITDDAWFKNHIEIDSKFIFADDELLQTTSSHRKTLLHLQVSNVLRLLCLLFRDRSVSAATEGSSSWDNREQTEASGRIAKPNCYHLWGRSTEQTET